MLDRKIKPIPRKEIIFQPPRFSAFKLSNHLNVYYVNKTTLPITQVNLIIPSGSIHDSSEILGISKITSMLLDEGAGKFSGLEISDRIEMLGSILGITSNKEFTTLSLTSLSENLSASLEIMSLIISSPTFSKKDFSRELNRLSSQLVQLNDDPSYLANKEFHKIIYSSTPYQNPTHGVIETLKKISHDEVKKFYDSNYFPNNSYLVVVSDTNQKEIKNSLENHFAKWNSQGNSGNKQYTIKQTKRMLKFVNKHDAAQSEIRIGHFSNKRTDKDFYTRTILNSILGGQFSSRINLNLREDKGYTYGAHSYYSYNQLGSSFTINTSVKTENTVDAINEVLLELEKIKITITKDELDFSKSYLFRRFPSLFETYSQIASNVALIPTYNLSNDYFSNYIENIKKVDLEDVLKSANESILTENIIAVVIGNKKIFDELKNFALENNFSFQN